VSSGQARTSGLWRAGALLVRASPGHALSLAVLVACGAAASTLMMVTAGLVIGATPAAIRSGLGSRPGHHLLLMVILFGAVAVGGALASTLRSALASALRLRAAAMISERVIAAGMKPGGVAHLEDPAWADRLQAVTGQEWQPEMLAEWLPAVIGPRLQAVGLAILLARFTWWAPLALLTAAVLTYRRYLRLADSVYASLAASAEVMRRVGYLRGLMTGPAAAKEVRLFGLAGWVADRMSAAWRAGMAAVWALRRRSWRGAFTSIVALLLAEAAVLGALALAAVHGRISLAELAVFAQAAVALPLLGWTGDADYLVRNATASLTALADLEAGSQRAATTMTGSELPAREQPCRDITFEAVTFGYHPDRPVLRQLNMRIPAGKSVAIVGLNGAGKTTLIKLLTRMYDPDSGQICVDGTDLRKLDPDAWRSRVAVVYQDFVKYPLPLRANIGFGDMAEFTNQEALEDALTKAGAGKLAEHVRWDTVLSRQFEGGTDLSAGQWQKVALARGLLAARHGTVLVLDEPTANMDVRAEAAVYERFLDLTRGKTAILISHRLSGVRKADLIYVLQDGQVAECGSHAELMARNGRYAAMFSLQAARFTARQDRDHRRPLAAPEPAPAAAAGGVPEPIGRPAPDEPARRHGLARSAAALATLARTCLRQPRTLLLRTVAFVPAAAAAGALQALWMRAMINSASRHNLTSTLGSTAALAVTIGAWQAIELIAVTDRITLSERVGFAFDHMVAVLTAGIPTIQHHESPAVLDRLHLLTSRALGLGGLLNWCLNMLQDLTGFVITAVLLATVYPPLLLLVLAALTALWLQAASQRIMARAREAAAPAYRLAERLAELATSASAGKEIRGYRLQAQISQRHRQARAQADAVISRAQWRTAAAGGASALLNTIALTAATAATAILAAAGQVSLGAVLLVFLLASRYIAHVSGLVQATAVVAGQLQTAERYRWLASYARNVEPKPPAHAAPSQMRHGITLSHVSFRYPGTAARVLDDVNLHLPAGSVVALVGENGAGKTTLVKLLCRLYEPAAGAIYADEVPLTQIGHEEWRARLSGGFQDFARFEFLARQAVGAGDLPRIDNEPAVTAALRRAGALDLIDVLPHGLRTQLGTQWPAGTGLSEGQWQKLAIGRALMRHPPLLLILDEPTAALDAETEHALFESFIAAARAANHDRTITILVTHRFSTVQAADLIIVLNQGTVTETGSHHELIASRGLYAQMYELQALAYQ
jgi:ABC-type multidrug transport system fused ATPase/permease subunit